MSSMSDNQIFRSLSEEQTKQIGRLIGHAAPPGSVVSLRGPLGAGKTVIAKGVAEALDIDEAIVSPTFTIVQEYEGSMPLHHMDLYRIGGIEEFGGIGGEELLYGEGITLIEWSEKIDEILPENCIRVQLHIESDGSRTITVSGVNL